MVIFQTGSYRSPGNKAELWLGNVDSGIFSTGAFLLSTGLFLHLKGKRFCILEIVGIRPALVQPAEIF